MTRRLLVMVMAAAGYLSVSIAHEGHGKMPGGVSAPHGGQIKGTDDLYLEVVPNAKGFVVYVTDHALKAVPFSKVQVTGTFKLPRQTQPQAIKFNEKVDSLEAEVQVKGAHRYGIDLNVTYSGRKERLSFNVEPQ